MKGSFKKMLAAGFVLSAAALSFSAPCFAGVKITSPADKSKVSGAVLIESEFSALDNSVDGLKIYTTGQNQNPYYQILAQIPFDKSQTQYKITWSAKDLKNGEYSIGADVLSGGVVAHADRIFVTLDNDKTPPKGKITSFAQQETVSGSVPIYGYASDDYELDKVRFEADTQFIDEIPADKPIKSTWDTTGHPNGHARLKMTIFDKTGNQTIVEQGVTVQNPKQMKIMTAKITQPAAGADVGGTITIKGEVGGIFDPKKLHINYSMPGKVNLANGETKPPYKGKIDTTWPVGEDGIFTIYMYVLDTSSGQEAVDKITVNVNNSAVLKSIAPPNAKFKDAFKSAVITEPKSHTPVSGTVSLKADLSNELGQGTEGMFVAEGAEIGGRFADPGTHVERSWNTADRKDGWVTVSLRIYKKGDLSAPIAEDNIFVQVSNAPKPDLTQSAVSSELAKKLGLGDAGQKPEPKPDTTKPKIDITAPRPNSEVKGQTKIQAEASDDVGVKAVDFFVAGKRIEHDEQAPYFAEWDTMPEKDGLIEIGIRAFDAAGNESEWFFPVAVHNKEDLTPPAVSITSHTNGEEVSGPVTISADVTDDSGIDRVLISAGKLSETIEKPQGPYTAVWNTKDETDGSYTIRVVGVDNHNLDTAKEITVKVKNDDNAPTVEIIEPQDNAEVSGQSVSVKVKASDDQGLANVQIYPNFQNGIIPGQSFTQPPYELTFDSTVLQDGLAPIAAIAVDKAGRESKHEIKVRVKNQP